MSVSETINKLKSSWCCGYIEDVEIDFEELEELENMNNKLKTLEKIKEENNNGNDKEENRKIN